MDGAKDHRRYSSYLVAVILLLCAWAAPASAAVQESGESQFDVQLAVLWNEYLQAKITEDEEERNRAFQAIAELPRAADGEVFEKGSALFLSEGYRELTLGRYDSARREFLNAAELNRYSWPAYAGLASVRKARDGDFGQFVKLRMKGFRSAFHLKNAFFFLDALVWFFTNVSWVMMICFVLFTLLLCFKYVKPFYLTMVGSFEDRDFSPLYANLLAVTVIFLPLLAGANLFLVAAGYILLFFPFFEARERTAACLIFLFPLTVPFLWLFLSNVNYARSSPLLRDHLTHFYQGDVQARIDRLKANPGAGELANLSLFTCGLLLKSQGNLNEALNSYYEIPESSKYWLGAQVNKGNIHAMRKEYQEAVMDYRAALEKNANYAPALYNMSLARARQGDLKEAERLKTQALEMDPALRERLLVTSDEIDVETDARARLFQALTGESNPTAAGWLTNPVIFGPICITFAILGLAFVHLRMRNPHLLARTCSKCGRGFFESDSPESEWCSQCVNLYVLKEDLPSEAKIRKHEEVQAFNRRVQLVNTVGQIFLPGARKIMGGNAVSGLLILLVWIMLLVFCIHPVNAITYPFMNFLEGPSLLTVVIGVVAVVYWALFGLRPIFQED